MFLFIIIFISSAIFFNCASCEAVELEEAINFAIRNSFELKSQFYQYKSIEKKIKSAGLFGFLPDVSLRYSFDKNFNHKKNLSVDQKIIDISDTFVAFNKSNYLLKGEKMKFQHLKQKIALNAVKIYFDVIRRTEMLKLTEHKERISLEHLSVMKKRLLLGEVTKAEVSLAKSKFASSVSERVDAEGKLKLANIAYLQLIGKDPDDLLKTNNRLPPVPELSECLQLAKANNFALKAAAYQKKADEIRVIEETSKWWLPSLSLNASANFEHDDTTNISSSVQPEKRFFLEEFLGTINIVFTLDITILKRGVGTFGVSKAKMDAKKSRYNYYEAIKNLEKEVVNAWNNILTAKAIVNASYEAEKAAVLALEIVQKEVNLNLKTTTELLNTEGALFKARSDLIEAKNNYVIDVYNLLFMINSINL